MYAILRWAGKQYKLEPGQEVVMERVPGEPGESVELSPLVFFNDNGKSVNEAERLVGAKVVAKIIDQFFGDKVMVFKYKAKKNYQRFQGHRQELSRVMIESIVLPGETKKKTPAKTVPAKEKTEAGVAAAKTKAKGSGKAAVATAAKTSKKSGQTKAVSEKAQEKKEGARGKADVASSGEAGKMKGASKKKSPQAGKKKGG